MRYFPLSDAARKEMLSFVGVEDIKDLYLDVPEKILNTAEFNLPHRFSEQEVYNYLKNLANLNIDASKVSFFLEQDVIDIMFLPLLMQLFKELNI